MNFPAPDALLIAEGPLDAVRLMAVEYKTASPTKLMRSVVSPSGGSEPPEDRVYDLEPGQVRMDVKTRRLLCLRKPVYQGSDFYDRYTSGEIDVMPWIMEDVLTGGVYQVNEDRVWDSEILNEMEVLAWFSRDALDVEEMFGD